jgi:hypothetical protein
VLWDGNPRSGRALVLARFAATDLEPALRLAELWAQRYEHLVLGEAAPPGGQPHVLAAWHKGERLPLGE